MTTSGDGVQRVDVRSKWPNEAYDFTPWLAEHLDLLGAELGLTLEEGRARGGGRPVLSRHPGEDARRGRRRRAGGDREPVGMERPPASRPVAHLRDRARCARRGVGRARVPASTRRGPAPAQRMDPRGDQVLRRTGRGHQEKTAPRSSRAAVPQGGVARRLGRGLHGARRRTVGGEPALRRLLPAADRQTRADGLRRRGPAALRPYRPILHPRDRGAHRLRGIPRGTERRLGHVPRPHGRRRANQPHLRRTPRRP